ncbi:uncharacterized protein LOC129588678 [Paramacrobiotus metropolitanus]|uniref:uncharacterized protein LOC129588678 n=1 Tax=Paramacrobiotus metropolitanus TaxID=2943436 RepID=UPI002445BCAD|nr:uncharacterized protein LOC129588678 [Paramacrobiotus metropolitanus]
MPSSHFRSVDLIFPVIERRTWKGFDMRTVVSSARLRFLDPFLVMAHARIDSLKAIPDHPLRGIENITYILNGSLVHEDCNNTTTELKEGDVQWLSAGSGIMQCQVPGTQGVEGIQVFVNLSSGMKTKPAQYHVVRRKEIPTSKKNGVAVTAVAGDHSTGTTTLKSKLSTQTPILFLDVTLNAESQLEQAIPAGWNAFFYVLHGTVTVGEDKKEAEPNYCVTFKQDGDGVLIENASKSPARLILIAGQPLNEPVFRHGPFVMNSQKEILQTIRDFANKANGFESSRNWKSAYSRRNAAEKVKR